MIPGYGSACQLTGVYSDVNDNKRSVMRLKSIKNFVSAYSDILRLVFKQDRRKLVTTFGFYSCSVVLYLNCVVSLFVLIKMIGEGKNDVSLNPQIFEPFSLDISSVFLVLTSTYIASVVALYLSETMWYRRVSDIVTMIVDSQPSVLSKAEKSTISKGSVVTVRFGGIFLKTLHPLIIGMVAAAVLLYYNPVIMLAIIGIGAVAAYFVVDVGRNAKKIGATMIGDEDDTDAEERGRGKPDLRERIRLLSDFFALRAKGLLITNVVLVGIIAAAAYYWLKTNPNLEDAGNLIISLLLLRLVYQGIDTVVRTSVPLSRHYPSIRNFLDFTAKNAEREIDTQ